MNFYNELIDALSKIPGIGKKSATRIAFFFFKNKRVALEIAEKIKKTIENLKTCLICGSYTENEICSICNSSERDKTIICVVEDSRDVNVIEETGIFNGVYHVLQGVINPLDGIGPSDLRIKELIERIEKNEVKEVLIATNPTSEGETTFLYLVDLLKRYNVKISKLATGLPMGGSLEYADKLTLIKALQSKYFVI